MSGGSVRFSVLCCDTVAVRVDRADERARTAIMPAVVGCRSNIQLQRISSLECLRHLVLPQYCSLAIQELDAAGCYADELWRWRCPMGLLHDEHQG